MENFLTISVHALEGHLADLQAVSGGVCGGTGAAAGDGAGACPGAFRQPAGAGAFAAGRSAGHHAAQRLADAHPAVHVPRRQHARPGSGGSLRAAGSGPWFGRLGRLSSPRSAVTGPPAELPAAIAGPGKIANVSSIVREPNTENVEVHFNRLVPETTQGSLDDPQIRELLLVGAQSQVNPGVAQNSVSLLASECQAGHQCADGPIRNALLVALRYDKDAGVRLKR